MCTVHDIVIVQPLLEFVPEFVAGDRRARTSVRRTREVGTEEEDVTASAAEDCLCEDTQPGGVGVCGLNSAAPGGSYEEELSAD